MKLQNTEDNLRIVKLQFCVFFGQLKTLYYATQTQLTDYAQTTSILGFDQYGGLSFFGLSVITLKVLRLKVVLCTEQTCTDDKMKC